MVRFLKDVGSQTDEKRRKGFPGTGNSMCEGTEVSDKRSLLVHLGAEARSQKEEGYAVCLGRMNLIPGILRLVLYDS